MVSDTVCGLAAAILNNHVWYTAVVSAHGVPNQIGEHFWTADGAVPPYYSNLVTRTRDAGIDAQLARVAELAAQPPKQPWSMKDSHDCLPVEELERCGLRRLFNGVWYGLPPHVAPELPRDSELALVRVREPAALAEWERAWNVASPAPGVRVFPDSLLADGDVEFLRAMYDGRPVGVAILNRSPGAIGVSNAFADADCDVLDIARASIARARSADPTAWVVGYAAASAVEALAPIGVEPLGPLSVWVTHADVG